MGRGLAPSPDYRNKLFVPTQHSIFTPGPDNRLCNYYHELLHYHIKIMSYLCYKHLFQSVVCRVSEKNVPKPHTPRSVVSVVTPVRLPVEAATAATSKWCHCHVGCWKPRTFIRQRSIIGRGYKTVCWVW